jgi:hypothetical protein
MVGYMYFPSITR